MKYSAVVAFVFIASVYGNVDDSVPRLQDLASNVASNLSAIPGLETLPFNVSQVPTIEDAERVFREKCLKNSNEEAFLKAKGAQEETKECIMGLVNVTVLQEEMEKAKPTGDLDEVFRKYCRKTPQLLQCISNFTSTVEPCLDPEEREMKVIVQNITEKLTEFICFKEGDRIALFIAEGGPECLQDNQEEIQRCINTTLGHHLPTSTPTLDSLPQLVMGKEQCKDMRALQRCVVEKLESCAEPTPANIVESMFNFVYKVTSCSQLPTPAANTLDGKAAGAASTVSVALSTLLTVVAARLL